MSDALSFPEHWKLFPSAEGRTEALPTIGDPDARMRVLIADDDPVSREILSAHLRQWRFDVLIAEDGSAALNELRKADPPPLAILDWVMPGMSGLEICSRMREVNKLAYFILLTACNRPEDVIAGLDAGADDYLTKPFHKDELRARLEVGFRIIGLYRALSDKAMEIDQRAMQLQAALKRIQELEKGGAPIV